jgi:uncharacterized protein (TIGR02284 family)
LPLEDAMERTEREALHHLIEICRDGERGFRAAEQAVSDPKLKALFGELAADRARFATELLPHLRRLGGMTDGDGTNAGALHRGWINLKAHVPGHHDHAIVTETARGEHAALDAYDDALHGMLPPTVTSLIEAQQEAMQDAVERIRAIDMGYS